MKYLDRIRFCERRAVRRLAACRRQWPSGAGVRAQGPRPPTPNYAAETAQTLQSQVNLAPQLYASQAQYEPLYAGLNLQNLSALLNGAPATTTSTPAGWYDLSGRLVSSNPTAYTSGRGTALRNNYSWRPAVTPQAAQPGLLDTYLNQIVPAMNEAQRLQEESQFNNIATLGPAGTAAIGALTPGATTALNTLTEQANAGLAAGTELTPDQLTTLNNTVSGAQGARGISYGPTAAYQQVLANSQFGQDLLKQRQATAGNVIGMNQAYYTDPFLGIIGAPTSTATNAFNMLAGGNQMQPGSQFNPESATAASMYGMGINNRAAWNAANSPLSMFGQIAGGIGALGQGAGGFAALI